MFILLKHLEFKKFDPEHFWIFLQIGRHLQAHIHHDFRFLAGTTPRHSLESSTTMVKGKGTNLWPPFKL